MVPRCYSEVSLVLSLLDPEMKQKYNLLNQQGQYLEGSLLNPNICCIILKDYPKFIIVCQGQSSHKDYFRSWLSRKKNKTKQNKNNIMTTFFFQKALKIMYKKCSISKHTIDSHIQLDIFADTRLLSLSSKLVHAFFVTNHRSQWSRYKACGI